MRALAREGGVFVQLGVKGRDGHAGSSVKLDTWVCATGDGLFWEDCKPDLITNMKMERKKKRRRMSLSAAAEIPDIYENAKLQ
ncbi:hypothetical protein SDJN02_20981, partial [Cucurbita argyrosperma subsp. argyrosperma]